MSQINRLQAAIMAQETLKILRKGSYTTPKGHTANIGPSLRAAIGGTMAYPPDASLPARQKLLGESVISVTNETTLGAARRLYEEGFAPVALNFASARNPGGGFLSGARAQEESLCRASGLYLCLDGQEFYRVHREMKSVLYTDYALYSPHVPVIRGDDGQLLEDPWPLSFITSAAPNAGALRNKGEFDEDAVRAAFEDRIYRVLAIGALHGKDAIVLGAWGCGAFCNDPNFVAPIFAQILKYRYPGRFKKVVFAVLDASADRRTIAPFEAAFESESG
jgi:uncharacterized protein (TIGR02452 family)